MSKLDRRSFLKLMGVTTPALLSTGVHSWRKQNSGLFDSSRPNIIFILFDAMSARNLSIYGYPRVTTPNFERFAERSTVYHKHHSGGNYTIPGTASILSGTFGWTHRAINYGGAVKRDVRSHNIFNVLGDEYQRISFAHNVWAHQIVSQFDKDVDLILPPESFGELNAMVGTRFVNDRDAALRALDSFVFNTNDYPNSLVLGVLQRALYYHERTLLDTHGYVRGLPNNVNYPLYFRLENLLGGISNVLLEQTLPYFAYIHLFPPHAPYRPSTRFNRAFADDGYSVQKPEHWLSEKSSQDKLDIARLSYDQYIASIDEEFGHMLDVFGEAGVLDNSYLVLTSDHGEMFERGEKAHSTPLLFEPIVHVPLIISSPGQTSRRDVNSPTSAVDLLPTFAQIAGKPVPTWTNGKPLPGLGGDEDMDRSTFVVEAKLNSAFAPLTKATVAMYKGNYKLIYYTGYGDDDSFELFNMYDDVEELDDLYPARPSFAKNLKDELLEALNDANKPYVRGG